MRMIGACALGFVCATAWTLTGRPPVLTERVLAAQAASAASTTYQDVYNGWKWWHVYCFRCHGTDAIGTTQAPNLIDTNARISRAAFLKVVRDGVPDKGMQAWDKMLDTKQIGQLYVYVRARADKVLPPGRPDEVGPNAGLWVPPKDWRAR